MIDTIFVIGRAQGEVDIYIDDKSVSSQHAQLVFKNGTLTLINLESKNGIFINSILIDEPTQLKTGDQITFGSFVCSYQDLLSSVMKAQFAPGNSNESILLIHDLSNKRSKYNHWLLKSLIIIGVTILFLGLSFALPQFYLSKNLVRFIFLLSMLQCFSVRYICHWVKLQDLFLFQALRVPNYDCSMSKSKYYECLTPRFPITVPCPSTTSA